jgi:hypothetical protein
MRKECSFCAQAALVADAFAARERSHVQASHSHVGIACCESLPPWHGREP